MGPVMRDEIIAWPKGLGLPWATDKSSLSKMSSWEGDMNSTRGDASNHANSVSPWLSVPVPCQQPAHLGRPVSGKSDENIFIT